VGLLNINSSAISEVEGILTMMNKMKMINIHIIAVKVLMMTHAHLENHRRVMALMDINFQVKRNAYPNA
jgi:hypothetical protein